MLPELLTRCLQQQQQLAITNTPDRSSDRKNFLHPESAATALASGGVGGSGTGGPVLSHSRSVPPSSPYHWPTSPILPPVSSRTPHLVPEPLHPNS